MHPRNELSRYHTSLGPERGGVKAQRGSGTSTKLRQAQAAVVLELGTVGLHTPLTCPSEEAGQGGQTLESCPLPLPASSAGRTHTHLSRKGW